VKVKLNSHAARVIASVLIVLQVGLMPASAAAPAAGGAGTSTPIAAPRVDVNRSAPALRAQPSEPSFSADPSDAEIVRARVFGEPFVPIARQREGSENVDLARVIRDQARSSMPEDVTRFEVFLRDHPTSRWSAAVLLGVGIVYRQTGYLTRALDRFERAWTLLEKETEPRAKALGDRAIAELADLNARLGRAERVETLFAAARKRDMRGPAAEKLAATENVVAAARLEVRRAFRCGPMALERALSSGTLTAAARQRILKEGSTEKGTSLSQLLRLSQAIDVPMQMAWREPGAVVITPSVVHWRSGHFAAITADDGRRSRVDDPVFGGQMSVTRPALDEEASGAFLVPAGQLPNGWRPLSGAEGDLFWGRGETSGPDQKVFGSCPRSSGGAGCPSGPCRMADYKVNLLLVNLHVSDSPVGYEPPVGPSMQFTLAYNQREYFQPQIPSYSNFGPKWTFGWFSYVEDNPADANQSPNVYLKLGGVETYYNYNAGSQTYGTHYSSRAVLARTSSTAYERRLPDGSVEVFAQADGSTVYPRRVFLTAIRDPQGNQVNFAYTYDIPTGALLLSSATDKIGQVTTFQYGGSDPRKITRVTDPFGRYASFEYDPSGRLSRITDVIGITSEFTYGTNDFISSLTTPYGTTTFQTGMSGTDRWLEATDPLGAKERIEYRGATTAIPPTESVVPSAPGLATTNAFIYARNTFYWDKRAMASMPYSIDYRKARITHWLHSYFNNSESSGTIESEKAPLENRIWYNYPGNQGAPAYEGTSTQPTIAARVLDDGTTQVYRYEYNSKGNKTKEIDPGGRESVFVYGNNNTPDPDPTTGTGIDLLQVKQKKGAGYDLVESRTYDSNHRVSTVTDAAGQVTSFTYDAQGQLASMTTPARSGITENRTTIYSHDTNGVLQTTTGPLNEVHSFTYDGYGRVRTLTDPDGYVRTYDYDALDRPTRITYPDGSFEETTYDRLDVGSVRDRLGRRTHVFHDALRHQVAVRDALGRTLTKQWCTCGSLDKIVDGNQRATSWERDVQGRITKEIRADSSSRTVTYEATTSRVKTITDQRNQTITYGYALDDNRTQVTFTNAVIPTTSLSRAFDPAYDRLLSMTDSTGTTTFTYYDAGVLGAGQVKDIDGPLTNDTITYAYDELGRVKDRTLKGETMSWTYDAGGRTTAETTPVGAFGFAYDGVSGRLASLSYPNGTQTAYTYFGNAKDRQLQTIVSSVVATGATLSRYDYDYDLAGNIVLQRRQDGTSAPDQVEFGYDPANQLTLATMKSTDPTPVILKRYGYAYDLAGNRIGEQIDDSATLFSYDNMNRLMGQSPGGLVRVAGSVNEPATVTVQGIGAPVTTGNTFQTQVTPDPTTGYITIVARDPSGNTRTYTYQIPSSTGVTRSFTYDANGNLASKTEAGTTTTYDWDATNRLAAIRQGASVLASYSYDGIGRRATKTASGVTTAYVYDAGEIAEAQPSTGGAISFWHGFVDQHLARRDESGSVAYLSYDHLGSVTQVTNTAASTTSSRRYDSWGGFSAGAGGLEYGFTGRERDSESGLYYYRARYYDPAQGRFLSEDPLGISAGPNRYAYAGDNPVNMVDPSGLITEVWCRPVHQPLAKAAGALHCFISISCPGMPPTLVSFLGPPASPIHIVQNWQTNGTNNDVQEARNWKNIHRFPVTPCSPGCPLEHCVVNLANKLISTGWTLPNYSAALGPNSNSFANRLVLQCGGKVGGNPGQQGAAGWSTPWNIQIP